MIILITDTEEANFYREFEKFQEHIDLSEIIVFSTS